MRAFVVKKNQLTIENHPLPKIQPNELLIKNRAFSVNHLDLFQREGNYPPPKGASPILGVDCAGIVEEVGAHVKGFKKGDKVMSLLDGGGYAEYVVAHHNLTMPIPKNLTFEQAAAIPEVFLSAYQALFMIGELQPLQWVLVHAGASGVGTAAIQLIKEASARCLVTCGSLDKIEACLDLGAEGAFNYKEGPFVKGVLELTENHGVDLIIDFIGASFWEQNFQVLAHGGAQVQLATLGGAIVPEFDLSKLMGKWATLTGTTLRHRSIEYKAKLTAEFSKFALNRFEKKKLKPVIYQTFSWQEVEKAHQLLKSSKVIGKIVLSIG